MFVRAGVLYCAGMAALSSRLHVCNPFVWVTEPFMHRKPVLQESTIRVQQSAVLPAFAFSDSVGQPTILQFNHPLRPRRHGGIMSGHDHGDLHFYPQILEQIEDFTTRRRIQIAGRFVCQ